MLAAEVQVTHFYGTNSGIKKDFVAKKITVT
jgi:hypothetical protein